MTEMITNSRTCATMAPNIGSGSAPAHEAAASPLLAAVDLGARSPFPENGRPSHKTGHTISAVRLDEMRAQGRPVSLRTRVALLAVLALVGVAVTKAFAAAFLGVA